MVFSSQELIRAVPSLREHLLFGHSYFKFNPRNKCIWEIHRYGAVDFRVVSDRNQRFV